MSHTLQSKRNKSHIVLVSTSTEKLLRYISTRRLIQRNNRVLETQIVRRNIVFMEYKGKEGCVLKCLVPNVSGRKLVRNKRVLTKKSAMKTILAMVVPREKNIPDQKYECNDDHDELVERGPGLYIEIDLNADGMYDVNYSSLFPFTKTGMTMTAMEMM